jgi:hypothetical protein
MKEMLQLDRKGPGGAVRMQIVRKDDSENDKAPNRYKGLVAAPPIRRPLTSAQEQWARRRDTRVHEMCERVVQFIRDRYGDSVDVDSSQLHRRLEQYIVDTSWNFYEVYDRLARDGIVDSAATE